jgi:BA14K-like protein
MLRKVIITAAAIIALGAVAVPTDASAYWRGGGWHGGGWGYYGGGFAAGAIVGGLLAAPYYYGPPPGYYYGPPPGDAVAYCMQRFRSYDPRSGTYLGHDGYRHPCP